MASSGAVTGLLREDPDPASVLARVLDGLDPQILERSPVAYRCDRCEERMEAALIALGPEDLGKILEEDGGAELECQFCRKVRRFTADDLRRLLSSMRR